MKRRRSRPGDEALIVVGDCWTHRRDGREESYEVIGRSGSIVRLRRADGTEESTSDHDLLTGTGWEPPQGVSLPLAPLRPPDDARRTVLRYRRAAFHLLSIAALAERAVDNTRDAAQDVLRQDETSLKILDDATSLLEGHLHGHLGRFPLADLEKDLVGFYQRVKLSPDATRASIATQLEVLLARHGFRFEPVELHDVSFTSSEISKREGGKDSGSATAARTALARLFVGHKDARTYLAAKEKQRARSTQEQAEADSLFPPTLAFGGYITDTGVLRYALERLFSWPRRRIDELLTEWDPIVKNVDAQTEGEHLARGLYELRIEARDRMLLYELSIEARDGMLASMVGARDAALADADIHNVIAACVDRALATGSQLQRTFWLDSLADVLRPRSEDERKTLFLAASRRIEATFAVTRRERHDAVRVLAERIVTIA